MPKRISTSSDEHALADLAQQRALGREVEVLDQLLGQRAAALLHLAARDVDPGRAQQTLQRDAAVLEEAGVLGGEHRPHHVLGQLRAAHRPAVAQVVAHQEPEHGRIERGARHVVAAEAEALDAAAVEADAQLLLVGRSLGGGERSQRDVDAIVAGAKLPVGIGDRELRR